MRRRTGRKALPALWLRSLILLPMLGAMGECNSWGQPAKSAADASPIVIGVSNVQSGPSSFLGQHLLRGSNAYFAMVNAKGGIHGRQISLIVKDDKYEPDPAVENTDQLMADGKILFLFDYVGTPTLTRILPLLRYYGADNIVNVSPLTGADAQRKPPYDKFVFNIRASYAEETQALVRYLYGKGYRRIGFLGQADSYGKSGEIGVNNALKEYGLKIESKVTYRRNQPFESDMKAQVKILRDSGVEAVICMGVYGPSAAFVRDARMSGWDVPIANVSFVGSQSLLDLLTKASTSAGMDLTANLINSQVVPSPMDVSYPLVADFRANAPDYSDSFISLEGWLNAAVVSEALRRAGPNPSRKDFISAMESLHGWDPGLGLKLEFSPTNHQGLHKVWLTRSAHGTWVPAAQP